jgi:hypothetical protein
MNSRSADYACAHRFLTGILMSDRCRIAVIVRLRLEAQQFDDCTAQPPRKRLAGPLNAFELDQHFANGG